MSSGNEQVVYSWADFKKLLGILDHVDKVYQTAQDPVEAFRRTICMDIGRESPDSFRAFVTTLAVNALTEGQIQNEKELEILDRFSNEFSTIPSSSDVLEFYHADNLKQRMEKLSLNAKSFILARMQFAHNLCRTGKGLLGRCPVSAIQGDDIYIIPGCRVPLVLRKTAVSGRCRLIGDAYVQGNMHGEAVAADPTFVNLVIE